MGGMTSRKYDPDEVLAFGAAGYSAAAIIEQLGLNVSERTIQRFLAAHFGKRPTLKSVRRYDPVRARVVAWMVACGLNEHYCSACGRATGRPCMIRELRRSADLGDLVFVCYRCATIADS